MSLTIRITEKNDGNERTIEIGEQAPPQEVRMDLIIDSADLVRFGTAATDPVKRDAHFKPLPASATGPEWVYTHDLKTDLVWTRGEIKLAKVKDAEKTVTALGQGLRRPTIQERLTLVKYDAHGPAIDTRYYDSPTSGYSVTSTKANWDDADEPASAVWGVDIGYGDSLTIDRVNDGGFVRAVRSGVPGGQ